MPILYLLSLGFAGLFVSAIGAWFSVTGLGALFSGASFEVILMAGGLEFSKFVVAAYLHRTWTQTNWFMKSYMTTAVVVLSIITSLGIFGFLTNAYQKSTQGLKTFQIQLSSLEEEEKKVQEEIDQIQQLIDQIPESRITKKINTQKEYGPRLSELREEQVRLSEDIRNLNIQLLETNTKVGPLLFVAKEFDLSVDSVVKYLTLIFVFVFDPLAICLIIATSHAFLLREQSRGPSASASVRGRPQTPSLATDVVRSTTASSPAPEPTPAPAPAPVTVSAPAPTESAQPYDLLQRVSSVEVPTREASPAESTVVPFPGPASPAPESAEEEEFATLEYGETLPGRKTS